MKPSCHHIYIILCTLKNEIFWLYVATICEGSDAAPAMNQKKGRRVATNISAPTAAGAASQLCLAELKRLKNTQVLPKFLLRNI